MIKKLLKNKLLKMFGRIYSYLFNYKSSNNNIQDSNNIRDSNNIQDSNNNIKPETDETDDLEFFMPEICDDYFSPYTEEECEILMELYKYDEFLKIPKKKSTKENNDVL